MHIDIFKRKTKNMMQIFKSLAVIAVLVTVAAGATYATLFNTKAVGGVDKTGSYAIYGFK